MELCCFSPLFFIFFNCAFLVGITLCFCANFKATNALFEISSSSVSLPSSHTCFGVGTDLGGLEQHVKWLARLPRIEQHYAPNTSVSPRLAGRISISMLSFQRSACYTNDDYFGCWTVWSGASLDRHLSGDGRCQRCTLTIAKWSPTCYKRREKN